VFTGDVTLAVGSPVEGFKAKSLSRRVTQNVTTNFSYVCDESFRYTLNPKYAWCFIGYKNYTICLNLD
jgi:hypothetical protein